MVKNKNLIAKLERGHIIKVSFDPIVGHEQAGYRPALVLSSRVFHKATGFALCIPITSKKKGFLFEIEIQEKEIKGVAMPHGARMLDLGSRSFSQVGQVSIDVLNKSQLILTKIING